MPYAPVRATSVAPRDAAPDIRSAGGELDSRSFGSREFWLVATVILVPFIYFLLIGRYGWGDQDDGFMLGFAWRVHRGQLPYRDFIYILPPLSPFLHSIWFDVFPTKFLYAGTRLVALYQVWTTSLLGAFVLCRYCFSEDETLRRNWVGVAVGSYLFSVCGVTPMPWYTFDGIFFGLLGASLLVLRRGFFSVIVAALMLVLSAGTKQSFYPLLVFAPLYLLLSKRTKDFWVLVCSLGVFGTLSAIILQRYGLLASFRAGASESLHARDALKAGLFEYLHVGVWSFGRILLLITIPVFAVCIAFKKRFRPEWLVLCLALGVLVQYLRIWKTQLGFVSMARGGYSQLLFVVSFLYGVWRLYSRRETAKQTLGFLFLLTIAWCASISWGYLAPIMFSVPFVVGGYIVLTELLSGNRRRVLAFGAVAIVAIVGLASLYPLADLDGRLHDHTDLGLVNLGMSFIISGDKTVQKLKEFETLRRRFSGSFVTLPAFEWSYILGNVDNPLSTDWPENAEIGPREHLLEVQLDRGAKYVFVDKAFAKPPSDPFGEPIIVHVSEHWKLAYDGIWYRVYENPHLSADVPHTANALMEKTSGKEKNARQ